MSFIVISFLAISAAFASFKVEGEWISKRKYDYRFVTTYEVKQVKKPLNNFPWIEEDCHDNGARFANWSKSLSYEITYGGSLSFNLLGFADIDLGKERSKTVEFSFQRWVTPTLGLRARHTLYEEYEIWEGTTRREYRYGNHIEQGKKTYSFRLEKINYGISVVRNVIAQCE